MKHIGKAVEKVTVEQWVRPGKEQTLEELRAKFQGRILRENDKGEILVSMTEEEIQPG